jgi:CelD/BcsL family acetyltransferase involved in cellulose biosynthesis
MKVDLIDDMDAFEAAREDWENVYGQDPTSTIFTSWAWFRGWLQSTPFAWAILVLHPDNGGGRVGFFPIGMHRRKKKGIEFSELFIGGNNTSDHTGFICLPDYRREAVVAFASYLQKNLRWDVFRLRDVFDPKVEDLVDAFPLKKFEVYRADGEVCPYIPLPESWESYLQDFLSRRSRKQLREFYQELDQGDYRVEIADKANFEEYLGILLSLHRQRWPEKSEISLAMEGSLMRSCFQQNALQLPVLFYRDQPIAAMAQFIDHKNFTLAGFMAGWNTDFHNLSPSKRLQSYIISNAIVRGIKCYDFLRGNESYKNNFYGCSVRSNKNILIHRKNYKRRWDLITDQFNGISMSRHLH